jgi:hypothetical protein
LEVSKVIKTIESNLLIESETIVSSRPSGKQLNGGNKDKVGFNKITETNGFKALQMNKILNLMKVKPTNMKNIRVNKVDYDKTSNAKDLPFDKKLTSGKLTLDRATIKNISNLIVKKYNLSSTKKSVKNRRKRKTIIELKTNIPEDPEED